MGPSRKQTTKWSKWCNEKTDHISCSVDRIRHPAGATLPVVDYSHIAQDAGNEVVNFAKWAKTEIDQAQTQLNTLQTYENTVLQVARFGNPAALRSLPGVSTVAELYQMYGQLSRDVATAEALMNPQRYQADMNSILAAYQLPSWNGFTTANGLPVLPGQGMFQFSTGSYNIANNAQQELQTLDQQRQRLQQQRDAALSSLQSRNDGIRRSEVYRSRASAERWHCRGSASRARVKSSDCISDTAIAGRSANLSNVGDASCPGVGLQNNRPGAEWVADG